MGDIMSISDCRGSGTGMGETDSLTGGGGCCSGMSCKVMDESRDYAGSRGYSQGHHRSHDYQGQSQSQRRKSFSTPQPSFDHERNDAEWRMVAKFVDRVLFWVYFVLSMATQLVLFMQMVPAPPKKLS